MTHATPVRSPQIPQTPAEEPERAPLACPWADLGRKHGLLARSTVRLVSGGARL